MGLEHFGRLGADVSALPIIDRLSADDPQYVPMLEAADLVYFSGGSPVYLFETMNGSRAWAALLKSLARRRSLCRLLGRGDGARAGNPQFPRRGVQKRCAPLGSCRPAWSCRTSTAGRWHARPCWLCCATG